MGKALASLLIGASALALGACNGRSARVGVAPQLDLPERGADPPQVINVKTGDYFFEPNEIAVEPGTVAVNLTNAGPRRHTFYVRNLTNDRDLVATERLVAGGSETVAFTILEEGRYFVYCAVPGHAERGETGWLTVKRLGD